MRPTLYEPSEEYLDYEHKVGKMMEIAPYVTSETYRDADTQA